MGIDCCVTRMKTLRILSFIAVLGVTLSEDYDFANYEDGSLNSTVKLWMEETMDETVVSFSEVIEMMKIRLEANLRAIIEDNERKIEEQKQEKQTLLELWHEEKQKMLETWEEEKQNMIVTHEGLYKTMEEKWAAEKATLLRTWEAEKNVWKEEKVRLVGEMNNTRIRVNFLLRVLVNNENQLNTSRELVKAQNEKITMLAEEREQCLIASSLCQCIPQVEDSNITISGVEFTCPSEMVVHDTGEITGIASCLHGNCPGAINKTVCIDSIDCSWADWSVWSSCTGNSTGGHGSRSRTRTVARNGFGRGHECVEEEGKETESCDDITSFCLTSDSVNHYYKVRVQHGVRMVEGAVPSVCHTARMKPVCHHNEIGHPGHVEYKWNVEGCLHSATGRGWPIVDISDAICGLTRESDCESLHGVFRGMKGWNYGECGTMPDDSCAKRSGFVSGPGVDYTVGSMTAQYFALCGITKG